MLGKSFLKNNWFLFVFLALDLVVVAAHFLFKNYYGFFNLDGEQNLNSAYSGLKLILISALAFSQFLILKKIQANWDKKIIWLLATLSFVYLGLDEMMAIHERAGFVFNNLTGLTGFQGESFNWWIYFTPLIIAALAVYARLIFLIWQEDKIASFFILAGALVFVLSIATEIISGQIIYPRGLITRDFHLYFIFIIIEEVFELLGATLFLAGIFKQLAKSFNTHLVFKE